MPLLTLHACRILTAAGLALSVTANLLLQSSDVQGPDVVREMHRAEALSKPFVESDKLPEAPSFDEAEQAASPMVAPRTDSNGSKPGLPVFRSVPFAVETPWLTGRIAEADLRSRLPICGSAAGETCAGWQRLIGEAREAAPLDRLHLVNASVNARIRYRSDDGGPLGDHWSPAVDTISREAGDCEDIVVLKLRLLIEAGIVSEDLTLVVVERRLQRDLHAVLAVRLGSRVMVLDNIRNDVVDDSELAEYNPLYSLNENGSWLHAPRAAKPETVALAAPAAVTYAENVTKNP